MYENRKCEYCGEQFAKNDDIVVCPDCGAPYHRKCWEAHGVCAHSAEHGAEHTHEKEPAQQVENLPEEDFIATVRSQMRAQKRETEADTGTHTSADKQYCENCGAKLISGDEYCVYCGHKQGDPLTRATAKNANKDPLGGFAPDEDFGGEKAEDVALVVRSNAAKMMPKLHKISEQKVKLSWSWPSFFFGYLYYFFRKLYKYGIIVIMAQVLLFNVLNFVAGDPMGKSMESIGKVYSQYATQINDNALSEKEYSELMQLSQKELIDSGILAKSYAVLAASVLVTHVACALLFNYLYLRHCTQTIERINRSADILGGMSRSDFRLNLLARGGVSVFGILLGYFAKMAIEQIVAFIMSFFAG